MGELPTSLECVIAYVVDGMHVSKSNRSVIREMRQRMLKVPESFPRRTRLAVYRHALKVHSANRDLYDYVMGGMR